ncbi:DUF262 domain-containing protein [Brachyspira innocens]|uniref:DUF262 domain-containing protein n=1 Tax=Brachyspira innocens TaxID=13264 RepID=UPI0003678897|nr:DUF262 domain-containing protein [Brachyspira innocens]
MAELIKKTFIDILKNENIIVPEIQREYVWGSEENIKNCKNLLDDIIKRSEDSKYNIGFLYSYNKDNKVYLIDGQQRFTTLYLTLLYLSVKENKKDEYKKHLEKFSYKVRNLTKEFIDLMIEKIKEEKDFFDIENKTWCLSVYKKDPTIKNIINFFSIFKEDKYKKISLSDIEKAEFWYFNTPNTSQGEELYITMNSRGEKIAEYEDIRVSLLSEIQEKYYKDRATKFNKIEHFFWKHRYYNKNNADEEFNKFLKQVIALSKFESKKNADGKESESNAIDKMDNIIYRYNSLELLYTVLKSENKQYLSELNNDKNILNEDTIIIPFLYIVKNIFNIDKDNFKNIEENTKKDLFQWLRFLYNIRFNHNKEPINYILDKIKEYKNNENSNIFEYFKNEDIGTLLNYYKNYNGEIGEFDLLESEVNKIKLLSIYNDNISKRNELQELFWQLEDNKILRGNIDYIIKYSLERINNNLEDIKAEEIKQNFFNTFSKYKDIFETCFNEEKVPRGILIRSLLTFAKPVKREESPFFQSHALYDNWSNTYNVHKVSLCRDINNLHDSFQNKKRDKYETNPYYKTLFDKIYKIIENQNNEIPYILEEIIIKSFTDKQENEQKENPFYKIIKDENYIKHFGYIAYDINKIKEIMFVMKNNNFKSHHEQINEQ